jgi:uncharacterized protein
MTLLPLSRLSAMVSDRTLHLVLLPTEACNCRCTYCYEKFGNTVMGEETVAAVKALIERRVPELDELHIGWFGGEPLLAKSIVMDISRHIKVLAEGRPGLTYRGGMATNGYLLTRPLFSELTALGIVDYQVTLDGPREIHDRHRVRVDGKGTYARIWNNLLAMRDGFEPFRVTLRLHIEPSRIGHMEAFLDDVRREFLPDHRFTVHFMPIRSLGGKNDHAAASFTGIRKLKKKLFGDHRAAKDPPYVCYASRPNSLMIYSNGDIGKCTVALYDPRNKIGSLHEDGSVEMDASLLRLWLRGFTPLDLPTLACPLRGFPAP